MSCDDSLTSNMGQRSESQAVCELRLVFLLWLMHEMTRIVDDTVVAHVPGPCETLLWLNDGVCSSRHSLNFTAAGEFYNELCTQSLSLSVLLCVSLLLQVESSKLPSVLNPPHSCDSEILLHRSSCWLLALWALQCSESKRHTFVKRTLQWFLKWP